MVAAENKRSVAIFNYAEDGVQDLKEFYNASVGYNIGDGINFYVVNTNNTNLSDISQIDEIPGNTGVIGQWIFRIDKEDLTILIPGKY